MTEMALMLHTQEPEYYDVGGDEIDSCQVADGNEVTQDLAELTKNAAQADPVPEDERISDEDDFRINIYRARPVTVFDGDERIQTLSAAKTPRSVASQANHWPCRLVSGSRIQRSMGADQ